jgi:hypothetical protein
MIAFLKSYQTLVVGLLGFLGVMATLAFNAWLARKSERRKIEHEANVLRRALVEEMKVQRDSLINAAEGAKRGADENAAGARNDVLTPLLRFADIFEKSIDKLGLLTSDEVGAVLDAYLSIKELTPKIRIMEQRIPPDHRRVEYGDVPQGYALVAHHDLKVLGELHSVYVPPFEKAIRELGSNLSRTPRPTKGGGGPFLFSRIRCL